MPVPSAATVHRASVLCGGPLSAVTLVAAALVHAVPALTPVGPLAAALLSTAVLSLPLWAAGLTLSTVVASDALFTRRRRATRIAAGASLGSFLVGVAFVWSSLPRGAGDALYLLGAVLLLVATVSTGIGGDRTDREPET
jgi:hypothetical protein